jgi:hypothetical protein
MLAGGGSDTSAFSMEQLQMDRLRASLGMHAVPHAAATLQPRTTSAAPPSLASVQQQQVAQLAALKHAHQQRKALAAQRAQLAQARSAGQHPALGPKPASSHGEPAVGLDLSHVDASTLSMFNPVDLSASPERPTDPDDLAASPLHLTRASGHSANVAARPTPANGVAANGSAAPPVAPPMVLPEDALFDAQFDDLFESAGDGDLI